MISSAILARYDVPVPRYTSYPTVPHWNDTPTLDAWLRSLQSAVSSPASSLALYVHLPFCESLCSFCGCNSVITRDHAREDPYVNLVVAEADAYLRAIGHLRGRRVRQLHFGGGTPTFLSAAALGGLVDALAGRFDLAAGDFEGSVEVDPRVTSPDQLHALAARGFRRVSLGVQDIDGDVQRLVNRVQPWAATSALCAAARSAGYESINLDLIYGLPGQTPESMSRLADAVLTLAPDRLAVYSFARVPWIKPAQRRFTDEQVPEGAEKRALYEVMRSRLLDAGYLEIGLDHFALPHDALAVAARNGTLHRNFMGYTERRTSAMLGLGVSAISETPDCYHQNEKVIAVYERRVTAGDIPTLRGHVLSDDDQRQRDKVLALMTTFRVSLTPAEVADARQFLASFITDGLVRFDDDAMAVTEDGRAFLRNIASFFDRHLRAAQPSGPVYSRAL